MTTRTNPGNNGNLNDLLNKRFQIRIVVGNIKSYDNVMDYLDEISIKKGIFGENLTGRNRYYVFDEKGKQVAKTRKSERIIELTKDSAEIKKGIEEIIYQ